MNRQEAAEVLTALKQRLEMSDDYDYCYYSRDIDAYDTALAALREQGWVKTSPQMASNNVVVNITGVCNWCGPERIGWFSVQFWVRACYGKRKWMSVTQDWKKKVKYCPMCGRKLEEKHEDA